MTDLPPLPPSAEDRATSWHCYACFEAPPSQWLVDYLRRAYLDGAAAQLAQVVAMLREPSDNLLTVILAGLERKG